ncbi:hypothetical protein OXX80_005294 [Metschnikowia pulcherrima]
MPLLCYPLDVDAVNSSLDAVKTGVKRPVVVSATGGGKTVVMSHLIPRMPGKRVGAVDGAYSTGNEPAFDRRYRYAETETEPRADIIVGSVNTLVRLTRLHEYDPNKYKTIVLDECHHAPAQSWTKILNSFGALDQSSEIVVLGFTATLERTDGKALGDVFEKVVYQRDVICVK